MGVGCIFHNKMAPRTCLLPLLSIDFEGVWHQFNAGGPLQLVPTVSGNLELNKVTRLQRVVTFLVLVPIWDLDWTFDRLIHNASSQRVTLTAAVGRLQGLLDLSPSSFHCNVFEDHSAFSQFLNGGGHLFAL